MKPRMLLLICAAGLLIAPSANAAPAPNEGKNAGGPVVTVQVKSIDDLLGTVKSVAKKFLPEPIYKDFENEVLGKLDLSVIKGIDTKRPMGLYATLGDGLLQGDFSKSSIVALIPVSDEKDFLALIEKLELKPEKNGDLYTIVIPNFPAEVSLRFMKGYAYVGISPDKLDPKLLVDPKEVIDPKEKSALALRVRIDRLPDDMRKGALEILAQAEDAVKNLDGPAKEIAGEFLKSGVRWLKMGLEEGKELALRIDLDADSGALVLEASLEAKPNTALAKSFTGLKPTKNDFAHIVGADSAGHILIQVPLFVEEFQSMLLKLIDWGTKEANDKIGPDAPKEIKELALEALKTLRGTVKSGDLDLAASLRGPDKNDQYTAIGAIGVKDTAALEKAIKAALVFAPAKDQPKFKLDSFKIGDVNVHEVVVGPELPPEVAKIFGKSNVMVAFAPKAIFVTFGPDGKKLLEEAITSKAGPKPGPLVQAEVSGKRLITLLKAAGVPMEGETKLIFDKVGQMEKISIFALKVNADSGKLVVRTEIGLAPIAAIAYLTVRSAKAEFKDEKPKLEEKPKPKLINKN